MCGMKVVVVNSDENGNIDLEDLKAKALKHKDTLVRLFYPPYLLSNLPMFPVLTSIPCHHIEFFPFPLLTSLSLYFVNNVFFLTPIQYIYSSYTACSLIYSFPYATHLSFACATSSYHSLYNFSSHPHIHP